MPAAFGFRPQREAEVDNVPVKGGTHRCSNECTLFSLDNLAAKFAIQHRGDSTQLHQTRGNVLG